MGSRELQPEGKGISGKRSKGDFGLRIVPGFDQRLAQTRRGRSVARFVKGKHGRLKVGTADRIYKEVKSLPEPLQLEVLEFVEHLAALKLRAEDSDWSELSLRAGITGIRRRTQAGVW